MIVSSTGVGALAGMTSGLMSPANQADLPSTGSGEEKAADYRPRELGLSVLQAEIRQVLSTRLKLSFGTGYDSTRLSASAVASESLSAASWLLREAPLEAGEELRNLREGIDEAGVAARGAAGEGDAPEVDTALNRIGEGIDSLETEAARNSVSSASVLTAESMVKQRSTVRIRTQDGDIVTLKFRQRESFSALSAADASGSIDRLEISSRSRMDLKVRGDLDDGEMQAIKAVFERAQEIAGSFFGGDLADAFSKASELEFDRAELEKVSMRFREKEMTRIRFAQTESYPVLEPVASAQSAGTPAPLAAPGPGKLSNLRPAAPASEPETAAAPAEETSVTAAAASQAPAEEQASAAPTVVERFVVDIRSYLRSTMEGFEKPDGQRYFYSESFKLSILRSVLETSAPEQQDVAADRAVAVLDAVDKTE